MRSNSLGTCTPVVKERYSTTGVHVPSEFDLMELNALTELTHRALVQEIKSFLKEKEIEADLDFKIIRGDRDRALKEGRKETKPTFSYFAGPKEQTKNPA